jgi:hypothetical protein
MKEFVTSLGFIFAIILIFFFGTHFTKLHPKAGENGAPSLVAQVNPDVELKKLLSEADALSNSKGGAAAATVANATPTAKIGEELYNLPGANSCVYCHGVGGVNGNVKVAAKLNAPGSWKIAKILGKADYKDPHFRQATAHLIIKGAIVHNSSYKEAWFDLKKAPAAYDSQMLGLTGAPSAKWLKDNKEKGLSPEVAAESLLLYLETLK